MIPLFKTHNSIGKSILTSEDVYRIAKEHELEEVHFVEDNLMGFLQLVSLSVQNKIPFRFGVRMNICNDAEDKPAKKDSKHKVVVFALDDEGCKILYKLYTKYSIDQEEVTDYKTLKKFWNNKHLALAVPFYDSFIFNNSQHFSTAIPDFSFIDSPLFMLESNNLPFDDTVRGSVEKYCKDFGHEIAEVKTICYENRDDAEAFQTYKMATSRDAAYKKTSLDKPNLDHFGSREFCWEAFLENANCGGSEK